MPAGLVWSKTIKPRLSYTLGTSAAARASSAVVPLSNAATPSILPAPTTVALLIDTALPFRVTTALPTFHRSKPLPLCRNTPSANRRSTHDNAGVRRQPCGQASTSTPNGRNASASSVAP